MYNTISALLRGEGIEYCRYIPLKLCRITKGYLLEKHGLMIDGGSVFVFAIPYLAQDTAPQNISSYAVPKDYHLFVRELSARILPILADRFPDNRFAMYADHSPIDERHAAALAGLGVYGRNGTVISERYSSFFFIAEIITDASIEECEDYEYEIRTCNSCGACLAVCPLQMEGCLSAITQKKGELWEHEVSLIKEHRCAWGCDICQNVCPHTVNAINKLTIYTDIPFFLDDRTPFLTRELIASMGDSDFSDRAYSWRGRDCILRNLDILEKDKL